MNSELERLRTLLRNYEDLAIDNENDDAYMARGNGFCDAKYSQDFIDGQIAAIRQQIADLEKQERQQP